MTEEEEVTLDINLKILGNSEMVQIPLPNTITIDSIKILAADYTDIPIEKMRLILTGRAMRNGTTLKDYDVHNGSTIHVVPERERNSRPQQVPPPPQQQPQNTESQQTQTQQHQQQTQPSTQPQPQQRTFPTPSPDLTELRTLVSNAQQHLSEISFAAATLQRAINQSSVGSSNEALSTLCRRFFESFPQIVELTNHISTFQAQNPEENNNEINIVQHEPNLLTTFQNDFMIGFNGFLNPFMGQSNVVVLDQPERNNAQTSNASTTTQNQNQNSTSISVEQVQSTSISTSYQGEISPGVQAMVDVQVINENDENGNENENENDEPIIEVNDINIDINNITTVDTDSITTNTTTETNNSGNAIENENANQSSSTDNQQAQNPTPPPVEEEDLSQIVLDPEEIRIVNEDATYLRNNFEPPVLNLDYFRQHNIRL